MQKLQPSVRIGDRVIARRLRWRVADVRRGDDCALVSLTGLEAANLGRTRQLLTPFDHLEACWPDGTVGLADVSIRRVSGRRWRRACRALLLAPPHPSGLRTAMGAAVELMPHQLEPALAVTSGVGARLLIADEVGLGKTIQGGLIVSELLARGAADRALILTPSGLRDQWQAELSSRFRIDAEVMDAREAAHRAVSLPIGVNPWAVVPIAIASMDYVKRPEVLPAVSACRWDVVVVDEAHLAAAATDRHSAVAALCARAAYTILLTATPHSGDERAFESLCAIGFHPGEPALLAFRRTRRDVSVTPPRRIHRQPVKPTPDERRVHQLLARLTAAVKGEEGALIMALLWKRALSSTSSLARTIERRLHTIETEIAPDGPPDAQLGLPFDDAGEFDPSDDIPSWRGALFRDPGIAGANGRVVLQRERRVLEQLAAAARAAARDESKVRVLRRLLSRLMRRGESAIVFTEYRDTLVHLQQELEAGDAAVLHGGLSRDERRTAIARFTSGRARLLFATDAAAEGLNLHDRCCVVVNLELPWNPMRLEQRIGRVDRLGQRRRVHAVHLVARHTPETGLLARLREKVAAAGEAIGAPDPLGFDASERRSGSFSAPTVRVLRLETEAVAECARLLRARRLSARDTSLFDAAGTLERRPLAIRAHPPVRAALAGRRLLVGRTVLHDDLGRAVASRLAGVLAPRREAGPLSVLVAGAASAIEPDRTRWEHDARDGHRRFWSVRAHRERAIAGMAQRSAAPYQPGLYDQRTERAHADAESRHAAARSEAAARIEAAEAAAELHYTSWSPVLVLEP